MAILAIGGVALASDLSHAATPHRHQGRVMPVATYRQPLHAMALHQPLAADRCLVVPTNQNDHEHLKL